MQKPIWFWIVSLFILGTLNVNAQTSYLINAFVPGSHCKSETLSFDVNISTLDSVKGVQFRVFVFPISALEQVFVNAGPLFGSAVINPNPSAGTIDFSWFGNPVSGGLSELLSVDMDFDISESADLIQINYDLLEVSHAVNGRDERAVVSSIPNTISLDEPPIEEVVVEDDDGSGGSISIKMGDSGSYNFLWSNGSTSGNVLNDLPAGSYSVTVTDPFGCSTIVRDIVVDQVMNNLIPDHVYSIPGRVRRGESLSISSSLVLDWCMISDRSGQVIKTVQFQSNVYNQIQLNGIPAGLYYVRLGQTNTGRMTKAMPLIVIE